jgi:aspartate aminotransferase-like enzyme
LPPGLAICSISQKALDAARQVENRGLYFDLVEIYECIQKKDHQYPSTPSLSHMYALDYQLDKMIEEGFENRFNRHLEMAKIVRDWAKEKFEMLAEDKYASNTLTTIKNSRGISVADLNKELGKKGYAISNGYGKLKEKTFRIAHMAETTVEEIKEILRVIEEILDI